MSEKSPDVRSRCDAVRTSGSTTVEITSGGTPRGKPEQQVNN